MVWMEVYLNGEAAEDRKGMDWRDGDWSGSKGKDSYGYECRVGEWQIRIADDC